MHQLAYFQFANMLSVKKAGAIKRFIKFYILDIFQPKCPHPYPISYHWRSHARTRADLGWGCRVERRWDQSLGNSLWVIIFLIRILNSENPKQSGQVSRWPGAHIWWSNGETRGKRNLLRIICSVLKKFRRPMYWTLQVLQFWFEK